MRCLGIGLMLLAAAPGAAQDAAPEWTAEQTAAILDATLELELDADLTALTDAEREALPHLVAAGRIMHELYLEQRHPQALEALAALGEDDPRRALFELFGGPIATTLDNQRRPFLPVDEERAGKALYPPTADRAAIEAYLEQHDDPALLAERTLVRRISEANIAGDLDRLDQHPAVDALIPGLRGYLETRPAEGFYAVPYALAYADRLDAARRSLIAAAGLLREQTPDFADYLEQRSRDFLSGDYEGGDAAWVSGSFDGLNLQMGSYETYDDALFGRKAFYGASLLARDGEKTGALSAVVADLQALEDALPYGHQKRVRSSILVGVYNVLADFGQARGANPATILPNDAGHARKYGRTILIRNNLMTHPAIFAVKQQRFEAVVAPEFAGHLTIGGTLDFILWHEVGHYLGTSETADGRALGAALGELTDLFEELKSDLVSLYSADRLVASGYYDADARRAHYAAGVLRSLVDARPRRAQPYQNMRLMQFNYFVEFGLLEPDFETGLMRINYEHFHDTVGRMLNEVLHIQYAGDYEAARAYVARWNYWEDLLHGRLGRLMQEGDRPRYTLVRYGLLDN